MELLRSIQDEIQAEPQRGFVQINKRFTEGHSLEGVQNPVSSLGKSKPRGLSDAETGFFGILY
jgi:hypothetical protein